jgi:hypothetical protein
MSVEINVIKKVNLRITTLIEDSLSFLNEDNEDYNVIEKVNNLKSYLNSQLDIQTLHHVDFIKSKIPPPTLNICSAKKAEGERCTRRRKPDNMFCGTHAKGQPHGVITDPTSESNGNYQIEVWSQNINGIIFYLDANGNVYQAEDIVHHKTNPKVIAQYTKIDDVFHIGEILN